MKKLDYYLERILSKAPGRSTYLSLIQRGVSGGRIAKDEIEVIGEFPNATEIGISGLTQDTFEYFVENYGHQFQAIIFWKCPLVVSIPSSSHQISSNKNMRNFFNTMYRACVYTVDC